MPWLLSPTFLSLRKQVLLTVENSEAVKTALWEMHLQTSQKREKCDQRPNKMHLPLKMMISMLRGSLYRGNRFYTQEASNPKSFPRKRVNIQYVPSLQKRWQSETCNQKTTEHFKMKGIRVIKEIMMLIPFMDL